MIYEVEENSAGRFDVRRDRRAFAYDQSDLDEAIATIERNRQRDGGEQVVYLTEADGYQRRLGR